MTESLGVFLRDDRWRYQCCRRRGLVRIGTALIYVGFPSVSANVSRAYWLSGTQRSASEFGAMGTAKAPGFSPVHRGRRGHYDTFGQEVWWRSGV